MEHWEDTSSNPQVALNISLTLKNKERKKAHEPAQSIPAQPGPWRHGPARHGPAHACGMFWAEPLLTWHGTAPFYTSTVEQGPLHSSFYLVDEKRGITLTIILKNRIINILIFSKKGIKIF